jgi:pimeloyl-ACP methyl ester carboxylesterase
MKKLVYITVASLVAVSLLIPLNSTASAKRDHWVFKGVKEIASNPGVRQYGWETARPPDGPFDKIALYRMVYEGKKKIVAGRPASNKKQVVFILPGTWSRGTSGFTDEEISLNLFLANHGYDVFSMDFRTAYLPNLAYEQFQAQGEDISGTADWTYGEFREDIKACVDMAKKISRAKKVFMAGRSRGGTQMFIYASKYWKQDLKGLISLDGGGKITPPSGTPLTEEQYNALVAGFKDAGTWLSELSRYEQIQFAGAVPYSENAVGFESLEDALEDAKSRYPWADDPPAGYEIETVSDLIAYGAHWAWGEGKVTNYYGGFMDLDVLIQTEANLTRYWPQIQNIEGSQMSAWEDCPYLDYDDNLADLPLIAFLSELFCPGGFCLYLPGNMTLSDDVTFNYLPGYGHLDVYVGKYSLQDVKEPLLEWLNERR